MSARSCQAKSPHQTRFGTSLRASVNQDPPELNVSINITSSRPSQYHVSAPNTVVQPLQKNAVGLVSSASLHSRRLHRNTTACSSRRCRPGVYQTACTTMVAFNIFHILGDVSHTLSKLILVWAIHGNSSAEGEPPFPSYRRSTHAYTGISLLTQVLYAVVFCTRYLDIFTASMASDWMHIWNFTLKVGVVQTSVCIADNFRFSTLHRPYTSSS